MDEVLGRGFESAGGDRLVLVTKARVLHALGVAAEVATLALQDPGRLGRARLCGIEPLQYGCCSPSPQMVERRFGPAFRLGCVVTVEALAEVQRCSLTWNQSTISVRWFPNERGHVLPDPLRAIAEHHHGS
jgi:hypothetical protein